MRGRFPYVLPLFPCLLAAAFAAGCGGGADSPTPTPSSIKGSAVIEAATPASAQTMITLYSIVQARLTEAGVQSTIVADDQTLNIDFEGMRSINFVTDLVSERIVGFKVPQRDGVAIKCKDTSGEDFTISPGQLAQDGNLPICLAAGRRGEIQWEPAIVEVNGVQSELTFALLERSVTAVSTNTNGDPELEAGFTEEGKVVLAAVSDEYIDFPLGIFLGDSLVVAPVFQRKIENGRVAIAGASVDVLEELRAMIRGGELPLEVNLVSIEQQ